MNVVTLHQRAKSKTWVQTKHGFFMFKHFKKQFFYLLRMKVWTNLAIMMFFILFIGLSQLPTQCIAVENTIKPSVKQINFTDSNNESSNINKIQLKDTKTRKGDSMENKDMAALKELKQITSVEYSWSEHINVGDNNHEEKEGMMSENEIDFYDLLNEINEYYDYYSNTENQQMEIEANGPKLQMSKSFMPTTDSIVNRDIPPTTENLFVDVGDYISDTTSSSVHTEEDESVPLPSTLMTPLEQSTFLSNELYPTTLSHNTEVSSTNSVTSLQVDSQDRLLSPLTTMPTILKVLMLETSMH